MKKKNLSQISIFILIGAMIIILMGYHYFNSYSDKKNSIKNSNPNQIDNIEEISKSVSLYVNNCLERQSENALNWVLFQNGKYTPGTYKNNPDVPVLVLFDFFDGNHQRAIFRADLVNESMKKYLIDTLPFCFNNFKAFENYAEIKHNNSFKIGIKKLNDSNIYTGETLVITLTYPITIKSRNSQNSIKNFEYKIKNVPLEIANQDVNDLMISVYDAAKGEGKDLTSYENKINEINNRESSLVFINELDKNDMEYIFYYNNSYRESYISVRVFETVR